LIKGSDPKARTEIENLIAGGSIEKPLHEEVSYEEMLRNDDNLWNVMFFTGYLTVKNLRQEGSKIFAELIIPYVEVHYIYETIIEDWFAEELKLKDLTPFHRAVLTGDVEVVQAMLANVLQESISFFDYKENYYHGFLTGILASIAKYIVRSNRESGTGRPDITLEPMDYKDVVIIIEVKKCATQKELKAKAEEALAQIVSRDYEAEWRQEGYQKFLHYGIAFCKKNVQVIVRLGL
jgi:hypothetical protein